MGYVMQSWFPNLSAKLSKMGTKLFMKKYGKLDPAWRLLEDAPALSLALTACMDTMLDLLREGKITSVHGVESFPGGKKVKFADGTVLDDIDTVVLCTGYRADFSLLPFVQHSSPEADVHGNAYGGREIPRLYMNIFPPKYADSMAILIASTYGKNNGFSFADVISMAISNIWRGVSSDMIPSAPEMDRAIDAHQKWIAGRWTKENTTDPCAVKQWEFQGFLHDAAGTGLENLGWGWKGWLTWLKDPKMSSLMRNGVETAYAFRYFETGKRATWPGAREAIIHTNELVKKLKAEKSAESGKKK
jgi:dimethylaniline monooxygenase (N-oxide forming)